MQPKMQAISTACRSASAVLCWDSTWTEYRARGSVIRRMNSQTAVFQEAGTAGSSAQHRATDGLRPAALLVLSAWCGLISGLLEVAIRVLRKRLFDPNQLYWVSRHFIWLTPLANLVIFLALGLL